MTRRFRAATALEPQAVPEGHLCCYANGSFRRSMADLTAVMEIDMGRGDKRSRKGKIFKGSYGNSRLHRAKKAVIAAPAKGPRKA